MSTILKGDILNVGQLENEIFNAINYFGCANGYTASEDPCEAQRQFASRLANAISEAVAKGVQNYLSNTVKTVNVPTLPNTDGTIPAHIHPNEPTFDLIAP
jgi:hypothetical protein